MKLVRWVISSFLSVTLAESSSLSFQFHQNNCDDAPLSSHDELTTGDLILHLSSPRRLLPFTITQFDQNFKAIKCQIYESDYRLSQRFPDCERKGLSADFVDEMEIPFRSHNSRGSLQICLIPSISDSETNSTNSTSQPLPTPPPSPSSKTTISAPTHPFMSTQAILIPLIFFAIIAFGGLSYHFELYRHLPFCSKPR
jgi:hypothetical protein